MLQIVRLDMIDKGQVEYKIDIPSEVVEKAKRELNERKRIPEF